MKSSKETPYYYVEVERPVLDARKVPAEVIQFAKQGFKLYDDKLARWGPKFSAVSTGLNSSLFFFHFEEARKRRTRGGCSS